MPVVRDRVATKPKLGGGGPGKIPHPRGFGGGGDEGDHGKRRDPFFRHARLRSYRIAMAVCITAVSSIFIVLTTIYLVRMNTPHWSQELQKDVYDWKPLPLPYFQLWMNSLVLALSSVTIDLARRGMAKKAEFAELGIVAPRSRNDVPWLGITLFLGMAFLGGQILVWTALRHQGFYLRANPSSSFFYLLTGLHALHLAGGLIALLYAACGRWLHLRFASRWTSVEVTAWYWHFMGVLWLGIFALLHFARG